MLIGQYKSKLTNKDRISIPKKFREELGDKLILARWYEDCLVLTSRSRWKGLLDRLGGTSERETSPVRDVDRFILGLAYEIELDSQGRFVIPKLLKDYAQLDKEVVFVGLSDKVEVWSEENWQKYEESVREKAEKAIEQIAQKES